MFFSYFASTPYILLVSSQYHEEKNVLMFTHKRLGFKIRKENEISYPLIGLET